MTMPGPEIQRLVQQGAQAGLLAFAHLVLAGAEAGAPPDPPPDEDPDPSVSLRKSGRVHEHPDGTVTVGFYTPYAAKQHEAIHFKHPRGGHAKFLENALKAELARFDNVVAAEVRARLQGRRR
jgi:hypothetical protein